MTNFDTLITSYHEVFINIGNIISLFQTHINTQKCLVKRINHCEGKIGHTFSDNYQ